MADRNINAEITVEFQNSASRTLPVSGENLQTLFGKLGRICTDLKPAAFSGSYNDLSDKPDSEMTASASGSGISLSGTADGVLIGLTIYGSSEAVSGAITSVGGNGTITVTSHGSGSTEMCSASFTSSIPLRGINSITRDVLTVSQSGGNVVKKCGLISDLGSRWWDKLRVESTRSLWTAGNISDLYQTTEADEVPEIICPGFVPVSFEGHWQVGEVSQYLNSPGYITFILPPELDTETKVKNYLSGVPLLYKLSAPVTTSLSAAEKNAFRTLRTFGGTTVFSVTDDPVVDVNYFKGTSTGRDAAMLYENLIGMII